MRFRSPCATAEAILNTDNSPVMLRFELCTYLFIKKQCKSRNIRIDPIKRELPPFCAPHLSSNVIHALLLTAASREPPVSLDSSIDGILVGDKRRRGKGRGKRGARTVEENAHRSSRSRHLSPMIPVSAAGSNYHGNRNTPIFSTATWRLVMYFGDGSLDGYCVHDICVAPHKEHPASRGLVLLRGIPSVATCI